MEAARGALYKQGSGRRLVLWRQRKALRFMEAAAGERLTLTAEEGFDGYTRARARAHAHTHTPTHTHTHSGR